MGKYRQALPQLDGKLCLTDSGLETTLIFHDGIEVPYFAAFDLLRVAPGRNRIRTYFARHAAIARQYGVGFVLESVTWRASADWGERLGYDAATLAEANRYAIALLEEVRDEFEADPSPMVISGCIGPRGDGYDASKAMNADEALAYHTPQIDTLAQTAADMVSAITMTNTAEAIGIVGAAKAAGMPVVVSLTVETNGTLPTGQPLGDAIEAIDEATDAAPAYYMLNCAHPTHFDGVLRAGSGWTQRLGGLRANASTLSHAELDEAETLDCGDPVDLADRYAALCARLPKLRVLGGCCGTDIRHIQHIARACATDR